MTDIIPVPSPNDRHALEQYVGTAASANLSRPPGGDEGFSVAGFLNLVRRHWLLVLVIFFASILGAYGVTQIQKPLYRASTTLYFADRQSTVPALDLLDEIENGNGEVATEMEVMRSRALAETVVDSLGMQVSVIEPKAATTSRYLRFVDGDPTAATKFVEFKRVADGSFALKDSDTGEKLANAVPGQIADLGQVRIRLETLPNDVRYFTVAVRSRQLVVNALQKTLQISRPNPVASVVQVSFTGHDPVQTRAVPDLLARTYLSWRSKTRKAGDRSTVVFLQQQIDTLAKQLYSAEEELRRFRESNQVADLTTQAQTEVQRMAAMEAQRADIEMQRLALRNLMREVKSAPPADAAGSPYRRLMAFPGLMTTANPALPLLQALTDREQRRADLLLRRTPADPDVQSLTETINSIETQIAGVVDTYLRGLDAQQASLLAGIKQFEGRVEKVPRTEVEYARLERNEKGLTDIYTMLQTRLREAQIAEAVDDAAVKVVDPAVTPTQPISPRPFLNLLIGGLLGLFLAAIAVLMRERLDRTLHTKEEAEAVAGAPVLALIPHIGEPLARIRVQRWITGRYNGQLKKPARSQVAGDANRLLLKDPQSLAAEAFRKLRTNITFARANAPPRVLIFTSPAAADGKSTSVMNLAIALVQQSKRVIVVDADMRRGGLHRMVNGRQTPGLSELLIGQADLPEVVQTLSLEPFGSFDLLAIGVVPPNPAELLASPRFRTLIEALRTAYDAVLIDSPPINLVTDAAIIGRETDGAIVVARAAKTTSGELAHAVAQLRHVQVPLTGMVLNDYEPKRDGRYNAPYYYGYSYDYKPYSG